MKRSFTLVLTLLLLFTLKLFGASGGPDAYGYVWRDSNEPNGPVPNWIPLNANFVQVTGLADDNSAGMFNMNWDFHFYWGDYNTFKVGSNGWISLANVPNVAHCFPTIPTQGGAGDLLIAPLMSDLTFISSFPNLPNVGQVWYWTNDKDTLVVSYLNAPWWQTGTPDWYGSNSFQILLNGQDSSITFTYQNMNGSFTNNLGCATDIVIGIENQTGAVGLQCFTEVVPPSNYAIKFNYPPNVLLSVPDVAPFWNQNVGNAGEFFPTGLIPGLKSNIKNVGNTDVLTNIALTGRLRNLAFTSIYTSNQSLPSLIAGDDSLVVFTPQANVTQAGQYYWEVSLTNSSDINPANNTKTSEVNMVNLLGPTAQLTYSTGGASTGSIGWNGGGQDDGVGVYMIPPVYPMSIASLEYYVASNVGESMIAAVYDDDGPNGNAGTLLWSDTIPAAQIVSGGWNTVTLPAPLSVTSGGFYVAWFMGGPNIFLGYEAAGPISLRSYEILGGAWAGYRDNVLHDFLIRVNITNYPCAITSTFTETSSATTVQFTNGSTGGTSYLWDFGDGNTSTAVSPTHTFGSVGSYNVCLIATNSCGSDTACQIVSVSCAPPVANFTNTNTGVTAQFTDQTSGPITSWLWNFGNGQTSTAQNPTHTYASQGTYNVCLIASGPCGADTICQSVTVCILPTPNYVHSSTGVHASFTNLTSGATSVSWSFGDGTVSSLQNPTHSFPGAGVYLVCLYASNACSADTLCNLITICAPPAPAFTSTSNQLVATFTDQTVGNPTSYLWQFGDGNTSTVQNPTHTYTAPGTYNVCLIVTDSCASDTACNSVTITVVGLSDGLPGFIAKAWPNPTTGDLVAEATLPLPVDALRFRLLDLTGRILASQLLEQTSGTATVRFDLHMLPAGLYQLELDADGHRAHIPVIKE